MAILRRAPKRSQFGTRSFSHGVAIWRRSVIEHGV
jgi:hypothetical protein